MSDAKLNIAIDVEAKTGVARIRQVAQEGKKAGQAIDKGMSKSSRSLADFDKQADSSAQSVREIGKEGKKAGNAVDKGMRKGSRSLADFNEKAESGLDHLESLGDVADAANTGMLAAGTLTAIITGMGALAIATAAEQSELKKMAIVAGLTAGEMAAYGDAAESVGLSTEQLADISKDTREKIGEFIATGGGEMADFFENVGDKVGLTAEQLQRMSGPEALIAVKKAMDDVNVSAEEQIFYLESMASDASLLAPLLAENGALLEDKAEQARELGVALDEVDHQSLLDLHEAASDSKDAFEGLANQIAVEASPTIEAFLNDIVTPLAVKLRDIVALIPEVLAYTNKSSSSFGLDIDMWTFDDDKITAALRHVSALQYELNKLEKIKTSVEQSAAWTLSGKAEKAAKIEDLELRIALKKTEIRIAERQRQATLDQIKAEEHLAAVQKESYTDSWQLRDQDLAKIKESTAAIEESRKKLSEKAIENAAKLDDIMFDVSLVGMSDLDQDIATVNREYDQLTKTIIDLGGAQEQVAIAEKARLLELRDTASRYAEQQAGIQQRFADDHARATMDDTAYELYQLEQRSAAYQGHIKDKHILDQWYNAERSAIITEGLEKEADQEKRLAEERADAYARIVADLSDISPELEFKLREDNIKAQVADFLEKNIPEEVVTKWQVEQESILNHDKILASDDFFDGFNVGLKKSINDMETWAEAGAGMADTLFNGMSDALTDFVMTGKLDFTDFANSIIKDMIRIMVQQSIIKPFMNWMFPEEQGGSTAPANSSAAGISAFSGAIPFDEKRLASFARDPISARRASNVEEVGAPSPQITVNIHEGSGTQTRVEQSDDGMSLDVIVEQVENAMSGRMSRGTGLAPYLDSRYGRR